MENLIKKISKLSGKYSNPNTICKHLQNLQSESSEIILYDSDKEEVYFLENKQRIKVKRKIN